MSSSSQARQLGGAIGDQTKSSPSSPAARQRPISGLTRAKRSRASSRLALPMRRLSALLALILIQISSYTPPFASAGASAPAINLEAQQVMAIAAANNSHHHHRQMGNTYRLVVGEYPTIGNLTAPVNSANGTLNAHVQADGEPSELVGAAGQQEQQHYSNGSQAYLERRNFGKRLHLNVSESILARTIRHLNAINGTTITGWTDSAFNRNFTDSHSTNNPLLMNETWKRDYEITRPLVPSAHTLSRLGQMNPAPSASRRDFISSLLRYRLLRPNHLLESLANLTSAIRPQSNSTSLSITQVPAGGLNADDELNSPSNVPQPLVAEPDDPMLSVSGSAPLAWATTEMPTNDEASDSANRPQVAPLGQSAVNQRERSNQTTPAGDYQVVEVGRQPQVSQGGEVMHQQSTTDGNRSMTITMSSGGLNEPLLLTASGQLHLAPSLTSNSTASKEFWQSASSNNIEQVIQAGKKAKTDEESAGSGSRAQAELKKGSGQRQASGERLKGHEEHNHWKATKVGEEQEAGSGKKGAKEGANFVKDFGHNKHGWKNVYHKEEYAQHQKYHDVFRDKNWDNKKAKEDESYRYKKGKEFKDTKASQNYDKDHHGSKYDYSKGNEWKRYEDDQFESGADESGKETGNNGNKKLDDWDLHEPMGGQHQNQQQPEHHHMASSAHSNQPNESPTGSSNAFASHMEDRDTQAASHDSSSDDAVIEQMKDKLDRLSAQTNHHGLAANSGEQSEPVGGASRQQLISAGNSNSDSDYDSSSPPSGNSGHDFSSASYSNIVNNAGGQQKVAQRPVSSHQSVNDIVKTAKRINSSRLVEPGENNNNSNYYYNHHLPNRNEEHQQARQHHHRQHHQHHHQATNSLLNNDSDNDDGDNDSDNDAPLGPPEKPMRKAESNNKNELRLKLELDLGKHLNQRFNNNTKRTHQSSNSNNNYHYGPTRARGDSSNGLEAVLPATRGHKETSSGGWQPREPESHQRPGEPSSQRDDLSRVIKAPSVAPRHTTQAPRVAPSPTVAMREPPAYTNSAMNQSSAKTSVVGSGGEGTWQTPSSNNGLNNLIDFPAGQSSRGQHASAPEQQQGQPQPDHSRPTGTNLAQVLPSRPIFVKHLQMNGGVVLGKVSGLSANKSVARPIRVPPMFGLGEDLTVETSLTSPIGDLITLAGLPAGAGEHQHPHLAATASSAHPQAAYGSGEYMLLFGSDQQLAAASGSLRHQQAAAPPDQHHHHPHHHLLEGEPSVVFETTAAGAGLTDEDTGGPQAFPGMEPGFGAQASDLESLMSEEQQRFANAITDLTYARPLRTNGAQLNQQQILLQQQQSSSQPQQPLVYLPRPLGSLHDHGGLGSFLKSLNYTSSLINYGPAMGGGIVAPAASSSSGSAMQQALGRLWRLPRVFGSAAPDKTPANKSPSQMQAQETRPSMSLVSRWPHFKPLKSLAVISVRPKQPPPQPQQAQVSSQTGQLEINDLMEAATKAVASVSMRPSVLMAAAAQLSKAPNSHLAPESPSQPAVAHALLGDSGQASEQQQQQEADESRKKSHGLKGKKGRSKKGRRTKSGTNQALSSASHSAQLTTSPLEQRVTPKTSRTKAKPLRFESNYTAALNQYDTARPFASASHWTFKANNHLAPDSKTSNHLDQSNYAKPAAISSWLNAASSGQLLADDSFAANLGPQVSFRSLPELRNNISQPMASTKAPNFGERILKSFKSKLNIVGVLHESSNNVPSVSSARIS